MLPAFQQIGRRNTLLKAEARIWGQPFGQYTPHQLTRSPSIEIQQAARLGRACLRPCQPSKRWRRHGQIPRPPHQQPHHLAAAAVAAAAAAAAGNGGEHPMAASAPSYSCRSRWRLPPQPPQPPQQQPQQQRDDWAGRRLPLCSPAAPAASSMAAALALALSSSSSSDPRKRRPGPCWPRAGRPTILARSPG